jgi:hypothetical protein
MATKLSKLARKASIHIGIEVLIDPGGNNVARFSIGHLLVSF